MKILEEDKNKLIWVLASVIVALIFLGSIGMNGYGMMGFGMGFGFVFMLLFWGLIVLFIVTLIDANRFGSNSSDPSTILKKRYASGEITKKRYEKMRKELAR